VSQLTGPPGAAYPSPYDSLARGWRYVLLLLDAGVWVELFEILPTHPANAGGFSFIRCISWEPGPGRTFGIFTIETSKKETL